MHTTRLRDAGNLLGNRLLDHLILGDDRLYSFADHGWPL
jgi:DNA repair protein RadC